MGEQQLAELKQAMHLQSFKSEDKGMDFLALGKDFRYDF